MRKFLILIILTLLSCESNIDDKLMFVNQSKREIFVKFVGRRIEIQELLNHPYEDGWDALGHFLKPDSTARFPAWASWETFILKLEDRQVHFFIFDAEQFRQFRNGGLIKNSLYVSKIDLTLFEVQKQNWIVYFRDTLP